MTIFLFVGFAGLLIGSLAVAGLGALRRRPGTVARRQGRVDPEKATREDDRRRQQILLAELTDRLAPWTLPEGLWTPRGVNPVTRRCVLEFEGWRPPDADGKRRRKRTSPDAPFEGPIWPYILSVDLHGLPVGQGARVADLAVKAAHQVSAGRVRLVTGHGRNRPGGESPLRDAVLDALRESGHIYVAHAGHVDVSADGRMV